MTNYKTIKEIECTVNEFCEWYIGGEDQKWYKKESQFLNSTFLNDKHSQDGDEDEVLKFLYKNKDLKVKIEIQETPWDYISIFKIEENTFTIASASIPFSKDDGQQILYNNF